MIDSVLSMVLGDLDGYPAAMVKVLSFSSLSLSLSQKQRKEWYAG